MASKVVQREERVLRREDGGAEPVGVVVIEVRVLDRVGVDAAAARNLSAR